MGGIEFEDENGKTRSVCLEGWCIPSGDDSDVEAFYRWKKTEEGREFFGYESSDYDNEEHYLSDKYPADPETGMRGMHRGDESDDEDYYEDYIDYSAYQKCRAGCYREFWYTGKHDCAICQVIACSQCARRGGKTCSGTDCEEWICGEHRSPYCPNCAAIYAKKKKTTTTTKKNRTGKKAGDEDRKKSAK